MPTPKTSNWREFENLRIPEGDPYFRFRNGKWQFCYSATSLPIFASDGSWLNLLQALEISFLRGLIAARAYWYFSTHRGREWSKAEYEEALKWARVAEVEE